MQEMQVQSPGQEDPLQEGMATHSSILAWKIPQTEEPGGLWSMGSQKVRHDWCDKAHTHAYKNNYYKELLTWLWWLRSPMICHLQAEDPEELVMQFSLNPKAWNQRAKGSSSSTGEDWCLSSKSWWRVNSPTCHLFVLFKALDRLDETHLHWGGQSLYSIYSFKSHSEASVQIQPEKNV